MRIRKSAGIFGAYDVSILITDGSGQQLADQKLSYRVDGGTRQNGITDKNGMLTITLSDGAHGIRLADTQAEIYIDNYSGFGIYVDQYREQPVLTFLADGSCDPVPDGSEEPENPGDPEDPGGLGESDEEPGGPEEETGDPQDDSPENEDETLAPQTGDDFSVTSAAIAIVVMLCCATAAGIVVVRKRQ